MNEDDVSLDACISTIYIGRGHVSKSKLVATLRIFHGTIILRKLLIYHMNIRTFLNGMHACSNANIHEFTVTCMNHASDLHISVKQP